MSTFVRIEPIPIAFRVVATKANLVWISHPFFSDALTLRIEFYKEDETFLDFLDVQLTADQYAAKGTDKFTRAVAICQEQGVFVTSVASDVLPRPQIDVI
jgi:hypothetical protein